MTNLYEWIKGFSQYRIDFIFAVNKRLGNFKKSNIGYRTDICKEDAARQYVLDIPGAGLRFLDVGAGDGKLSYLFGISKNLHYSQSLYDKNKREFDSKYIYYGLDVVNSDGRDNLLVGDVCSNDFASDHSKWAGYFDVIYSNNVFEHLKRPWLAAENIAYLLKPGGIVITIVPFSSRYHEVPDDLFRFTHTGIESIFNEYAIFEPLVSGYDISGRRNNWQGSGRNNDIVPVDSFGAWRETWFTVSVLRKSSSL